MMTSQHISELPIRERVRGIGLSGIDLEWLYGQGFFRRGSRDRSTFCGAIIRPMFSELESLALRRWDSSVEFT